MTSFNISMKVWRETGEYGQSVVTPEKGSYFENAYCQPVSSF